jgi:tetratricopeptide (TPR) repeat protein
MAVVTVFAESRWKAIKKAVREKKDWPPSWLADLHSAYAVLRHHPLGTDDQVTWHYDLLMWLGARKKAVTVLMDGLERFRDSEKLHRLLRERLLRWRGPKGLEEAYTKMLETQKDPAHLEAFAGLASIEAGDQYRRVRHYEEALGAYQRAIGHYENAVKAFAGHQAGADVAIALALASRARVSYQLDDDAGALKDILASFERSPGTAATTDGVGITPVDTANMLLVRLDKRGEADAAATLRAALAKLDPELTKPDIR